MGFNIEKFSATQFKDRTEDVPVPRLSSFFPDDETPQWTIRGLTGEESAFAKQAVSNNQNIEVILRAIGSKLGKDIEAGVKELAGLHSATDDKVPDELIQRFEWLKFGSIDPVCDHSTAVKLAANFPEDFYNLTNKIMQLTGAGRVGE